MEVPALPLIMNTEFVRFDQPLSFVGLFEHRAGSGEIDASEIAGPLLCIVLIEVVTEVEDVVRGDDPFSREQVDRVSLSASLPQTMRIEHDHLLEMTQTVLKQARGRREACGFRLDEEVHDVR